MKSRTPEERRSRFILAGLPLGIALLLILAIAGLFLMTVRGGTADGPPVTLRFTSDCPTEWAPRVQERAESVGIEQLAVRIEGSDVVLEGVFPDAEIDDMAALLTAPAEFGIYTLVDGQPQGEPLATHIDVVDAFFQVGLTGHTYVQPDLQPNALDRLTALEAPVLGFFLDGEMVGSYDERRAFRDSDLKLQPVFQTSKEEVRAATNWTILLRHPGAPCPARGVQIEPR